MGITHLSGLEVGGVPVFGSGGAAASYFGTQWFVDTVNGNDGNLGTSPSGAFQTMGRAFYRDANLTQTNLTDNDTIWFVGKVREQLIAPLGVTGVAIYGMEQGNVRDDDGAKWSAPASPVAGKALLELREQGWVLENFLMTPDTSSGACVKAHRAEDATYPDSSHFILRNMRFVGGGGTSYGVQDVGGNHHYIIDNCEFQTLAQAIWCSSTAIAVPLRNTITNNKFYGNTSDIESALSYSLLQGNRHFSTAATTVCKTAGGGYCVVTGNVFPNAAADIDPANGYDGNSTDTWTGNLVPDQAAFVFGDPA